MKIIIFSATALIVFIIQLRLSIWSPLWLPTFLLTPLALLSFTPFISLSSSIWASFIIGSLLDISTLTYFGVHTAGLYATVLIIKCTQRAFPRNKLLTISCTLFSIAVYTSYVYLTS